MLNQNDKLSAVLEKARASKVLSAVALIVSFVLFIIVFLTANYAGIRLYKTAMISFGLSSLFALIAFIHDSFFIKMMREEEEKQLLEKRKEKLNSIMDISEDVRFTAGRMFRNFRKFVPSIVSFVCFVAVALTVVYFWNVSFMNTLDSTLGNPVPKDSLALALMAGIILFVSFLLGVFLLGQSHVAEFRWLRPVGTWLIVSAVVMLLIAITALKIGADEKAGDPINFSLEEYFEKAVLIAFGILAVEFLITFVIEFYRPRTQDEDRPVYESRILAVFTEPGGVVRNIADALDYQFGFKVSRTWIYSFFERSLIPALLIWGFVLWMFTGIGQVDPGNLGVRESFGALDGGRDNMKVLTPGIHLKYPWPFGKIIQVPIDKTQKIIIGAHGHTEEEEEEDDGHGHAPAPKAAKEDDTIILWSGDHYVQESGYLVATTDSALDANKDSKNYSVYILEATLPVYYQVREDGIYDYIYNYRNINALLTEIGEAEATKYFASTDYNDDITVGKTKIGETLKERIQEQADKLALGIQVINVGLHHAHPLVGNQSDPKATVRIVNVAESYQQPFIAQEEAKTMEYNANLYAAISASHAKVEAEIIKNEAEMTKANVDTVAGAEAAWFESQLPLYRAFPKMYRLNTYLDFLENDSADIRKYVISSTFESRILDINLEEKSAFDGMNADLSSFGR